MSTDVYRDLRTWMANRAGYSGLMPMLDEAEGVLASSAHGDLPRWREALASLPEAESFFDGAHAAPSLGRPVVDPESLRSTLMELHPWRKGPLNIGGLRIDTEWRSDWKWNRLTRDLDLSGHVVLDVGSGNGYYGWRMLDAGADCVIGVDPTLVFVMQWLACRHFSGEVNNFVLPLGIEHLPANQRLFDTVFSMGVLYHRKDPVKHLQQLSDLARPGGKIVLETLVLDQHEEKQLHPEGRYARMRNVWSIPTVKLLQKWLRQAGLPRGQVLDVSVTTIEEQRSTKWMQFESLQQCLDPSDSKRTIEGYPAPVRAAMLINVPA